MAGKLKKKVAQNGSEPEIEVEPYDLAAFEALGAPGSIGDLDGGLESDSIALDYAFGGIGIPRGRFTMIEGNADTGKTSIAILYGAKSVQRGEKVLVINREGRWNVPYAQESGMGLPGKDYLMVYPDSAEAACEAIRLAAKRRFDCCILESIAALAPMAEIVGEFKSANVGILSRIMSKFFRDACLEVAASGMAVLMTNQLRDKIGVLYGSPETAPGGRAKDFNSTVIARLSTPARKYLISTKSEKYEVVSMVISGKTKKSTGVNQRKIAVDVQFVSGVAVNKPAELMDFGLNLGMFQLSNGETKHSKAGSWVYNNVDMGSTKDAALYLADENNWELAQKLEEEIRVAIRTGKSVTKAEKEEEDEANREEE